MRNLTVKYLIGSLILLVGFVTLQPQNFSDLIKNADAKFDGREQTLSVSDNPNKAKVALLTSDGSELVFTDDTGAISLKDIETDKTIWRHSDLQNQVVRGISISESGKVLASFGKNAITVWKAESGQISLSVPLEKTASELVQIALSPYGNYLVGVSKDKDISFWKLEAGNPKKILLSQGSDVVDLTFSPNGSLIAGTVGSGSQSKVVLWNTINGELYKQLKSDTDISDIAFSSNSKVIAVAEKSGYIKSWDINTGTIKNSFNTSQELTAIAFSPDSTYIASGAKGDKAKIELWSSTSGKLIFARPNEGGAAVDDLLFSNDGSLLAGIGADKQISILKVPGGELQQLFSASAGSFVDAAFAAKLNAFASIGGDGNFQVWDLTAGSVKQKYQVKLLTNPGSTDPQAQLSKSQLPIASTTSQSSSNIDSKSNAKSSTGSLEGNVTKQGKLNKFKKRSARQWKGIKSLAISADGSEMGAGSVDGTVRVFKKNGKERWKISGHHGRAIAGLGYRSKARTWVTVGIDTEIKIWDDQTGNLIKTFYGPEHPPKAIVISPDGRLIAVGGEDTRVFVYDANAGKLSQILYGHKDFVNGLAFGPDNKTLASAGSEGQVLLWDVTSGKLLKTMLGHTNEVNTVAISPDGGLMASGSADNTIILWNLVTGNIVNTLKGHQGSITSVAFSPNGKKLVSSGEDGRMLVWNPATGELKKQLAGSVPVNALTFSPDGNLHSAAENGELNEFNTDSGDKLDTISVPVTLPALEPQSYFEGANSNKTSLASTNFDNIVGNEKSNPGLTIVNTLAAKVFDWLIPVANADPNQGTGGPILVITPTATPGFGNYYAEILRNEGLTEFAVANISTVTAGTLSAYDVVILAQMTLTSTQVSMLNTWVTNGGNLIAMRPDTQLATLLGLTSAGTTLANGYMLVNTSVAPGSGIVGETIQYHGIADRYTLNGASSIATLYSNATTATASPAVTLRSVGSAGGQAAAFTYDLARSVINTRQGNPAWVGQNRDRAVSTVAAAVIRSNDLYYGADPADNQPDWIDFNKLAIPQADEQQRLLANLIIEMNRDKKPLPRFWYFPAGVTSAVLMTGDDHANGGTIGLFDSFIANSPSGCSVQNWECNRYTSYAYTGIPMTQAQAVAYNAQGFEVGLHINTGCTDYTPTSLAATYAQQVAEFNTKFSSALAPVTMRHHCLVWSDWATGVKTQINHGIRLDTSYYFWPPSWVLDRPGLFTGSAMPMRFADTDGSVIDGYQATSQMTDESGQTYPITIDSLLNKAVGSEGYFGIYNVNAHTDFSPNPVATSVLTAAVSRGVPVITSKQVLNWLDFRNNATFSGMTWSGNSLSFTVIPGSGSANVPVNRLQVLLPKKANGGLVLSGITRSGSNVSYTSTVIKGVDYAAFSNSTSASGSYVATYAADTTAPTVASRTPAVGATGVSTSAPVTVTFSESIDPATISSSTFELRNPSSTIVPSTVTYNSSTLTAILTPASSLAASTTYTVTVKGGATAPQVRDLAGISLAANVVWSFTTGALPCTTSACSAWPATTVPGTPSFNDSGALELGVKFRSDIAGFVTGVRFYKGSANTGTHIGNLWTSTGTPLATAIFTNETATGWQQVTFSSPVSIQANTTYVASYYAPNGGYALSNSPEFSTQGVDNPPIHLLQNGVDGGNGLFTYSTSTTFPISSSNSSNYWVDVLFTTSGGTDTTAPTVSSQSPASGATTVAANSPVTVTFSEPMSATTINTSTIELRNTATSALIASSVSYDSASRTATLTPSASLTASTQYTALVKGGATDPRVKDSADLALAANYSWNFTTATSGGTTGCSSASTIWPSTTVPAVSADPDTSAVELGVKFRATQNGFICGIRFYKGSTNTGTHVGKLWSSTGTILATATFTGETASGWQQVNFASPIAVTAGTQYVASYFAPVGRYSTNNSFFTAGVTSGSLYAFGSTESGGNGVYLYGSAGGFPNNSFQSTNYWVDVAFTTSIGPDTTPPTVVSTQPLSNATGVVPASPVTVTFSELMDAATIISANLELRNTATNVLVPRTVTYNAATNTATITPSASLTVSTQYTAKVLTGAKDSAGNALPSDYIWQFTTGVDPCSTGGNPIVCENSLPGNPSSQWDITGAGDLSIQGYATDISVNRGQTVNFKVDTTSTNYRLDIYRLGYYNGNGARLVTTVQPSAFPVQPACINHAATGLMDCGNWSVTASWAVPANATSGIYVAKAIREDGANTGASHIVFIVRDDASTSDILFQTADTTWQAYNNYGGNNFYGGSGPGGGLSGSGRAYKLSYNRPFNTRNVDNGQDWLFNAEYPMVRWLEANGYNVSYTTGVDSDRFGSLIRNHKMFMSNAHDEYWSGQQRANVEAARDAVTNPVNLTFFSGNEVFWKTRWENNITNTSGALGTNTYRTLVCYKETHQFAASGSIDPTSIWTGTWRDPRGTPPADGGRPESALLGNIFMVNDGATTNITVPQADGQMRFWRGTSVANLAVGGTATLPNSTLGYEWDVDLDNGYRPAGVVRLSTTIVPNAPILTDYGSTFGSGLANHALTLYKAASGAKVFGAGTVQWAWGLDSNHDRGSTPASPDMRQATVNLFYDMGILPNTLQSGLSLIPLPNDTTAPVSVITTPAAGSTIPLNSLFVISGTASDIGGRVGGVEVSTDGGATWHPASGRTSWTYSWNTPSVNGSVNIKVRAVDDSLNLETPGAGVSVNVGSGGSDITPPTVTLTAPANAATVTGTAVSVTANASDNVGVASVQFLLDGAALGSPDTAAPYSITWNSTTATNGTHTLSARASDAAGNNTTSTGVSVTVSNGVITNTGLLSPTANAAVTTSAGDNNGFQITATNAYADGGGVAADTNSGNNTSTSCTNTGKDKHNYSNYGINLPVGATIRGIEVRLDARVDATLLVATSQMCVQISWDGGTSWTAAKTTANLTTAEGTYILGSATDTWGRTWTVTNFSNANFRVRIVNKSSNTARDFSLDWAAVRVTYQ
jgi:WD40 repeat protein